MFVLFHKKARWLLFIACGVVVGCFDPIQSLQKESLQLVIRGLHKDTRFLRVELTICEGSRIVGTQRVFEHEINLPFGSETFFLPRSLKHSTVDMIVSGYGSPDRLEVIQHRRQRWVLLDAAGVLPTIDLKDGPLVEGYRRCEMIIAPNETKQDPGIPAVVTVGGGQAAPQDPSRYQPPWSPDPKPLPSVPALASLHDEVELSVVPLSTLPFRFPVVDVAAQGRWIAVADATSEVRVHDVWTGTQRVPPFATAPDGCMPKALSMQGDVLAILCSGNDYSRVFFRSLDTLSQEYPKSDDNKRGRYYGLEEGFDVGKDSMTVKIIGHLAMILNPKALYLFRLDQVNQSVRPIPLSSLGNIESPTALAVSGQHVFLADGNDVGDIHQFRIHSGTEQIEKMQTLAMGEPTHILAANDRYVAAVVGNPKEWAVKVLTTPFVSTVLRVKFQHKPSDVALLSHTLLVLQENPPSLTLYDLRTKTQSAQSLSRAFQRLVMAGEKVLLIPPKSNDVSKDTDFLYRATFSTRQGLVSWRVGANPSSLHLIDSTIWIFDPMAQRMRQLNRLKQDDEVPQPYVQTSFPLQEADAQGWMGTYKNFLFFSGQNRKALYVRQLPPRLDQSPVLLAKTTLPIQAGRIVPERHKLYLLLWDNTSSYPQMMEISLFHQATTVDDIVRDPVSQKNQEPVWRTFPYRNWKPVDIYPTSSSRWIIANRSQFLYQVGSDLQIQGKSLALDGSLIGMVPMNEQLAVAYRLPNSGSQVVMVDIASFSKKTTIPTYSDSDIHAMTTFGQYLLLTDRFNDIVMLCDPSVSTACLYHRVGCGPSALAVIGKNAQDARIITANVCDDSLSLFPFLPQ